MYPLENANIRDTKKYFLLFTFLFYWQKRNFKILFQVNECQTKVIVKDFYIIKKYKEGKINKIYFLSIMKVLKPDMTFL